MGSEAKFYANYMYTRGIPGDGNAASGMVEQRIVKEKWCMLQPDGTTKIVGDVEGWVYIIYVDEKTADCFRKHLNLMENEVLRNLIEQRPRFTGNRSQPAQQQ